MQAVPAVLCFLDALLPMFRAWDHRMHAWLSGIVVPALALSQLLPAVNAAYQANGFDTKQLFQVEEVREICGVALAMVWCAVNAAREEMRIKDIERKAPGSASAIPAVIATGVPLVFFGVWWKWNSMVKSGEVHVSEHCQGIL